MGARIYIPEIGRFLQVDPVEGGTQNDYVYPVDPVNGSDFSGKFLVLDDLVTALLAITIAYAAVMLLMPNSEIAHSLGKVRDALRSQIDNWYSNELLRLQNFYTNMAFLANKTSEVTAQNSEKVEMDIDCRPSSNPYTKQNQDQLNKSKKSMERNIEEHLDKITNPDKYIDPSRIKGDPTLYREGLLRKWGKEIEVFRNELEKIDDALDCD